MGIYSPDSFPTANDIYGTKFLSGNYAQIAEVLGCYSERIEDPSEIIPAIRRARNAIASGQPALLEMVTSAERAFSYVDAA